MKTLEIKIQNYVAVLLNNSLSVTYNKIERIVKFNRTNYINSKQYDFSYSVDWKNPIPQICNSERNSYKKMKNNNHINNKQLS